MDERLRFVARLLDGEAMTDVCREFGISRKTGYKIFDRYREHGLEALTDRSRRPIRYANQLPGQVEGLIVSLKRDKPHWGARKIPELLVRRLAGDVRVPARSTRTRRIVFSIVDLDGDRKRFCFSNLRCRDKTSNRKFNFGGFTHGVIPGSSHTQALGISSPVIDEDRLMGSYIMERWNGTICRTGRVVEADCDLHH